MDDPVAVRDELHRLELALAARDGGGVEIDLGSLIADDFVEHGLSARRWDAKATRTQLATQPPLRGIALLDFGAAVVGPGLAVTGYRTAGPGPSRRASIWTIANRRWVVRYNVAEPDGLGPAKLPVGDAEGRLDPDAVNRLLERWREDTGAR